MATDKKEHLLEVLDTHKMSHIDVLFDKYKAKSKEIKEELEEEYKSDAYNVLNSGSYAKHTAINIKFDLDLVIPFKKDTFTTLEEMFNEVYDFLVEKYGAIATVRKQKVSIGIIFYADEDGDEINIDVVPGRELNKDQYEDDKKINLYVDSKYGFIDEKTYLQTNINAQIEHIKSRDNERKVIRLLKIWKATNNEPYKSFFFELIVIKAFDSENITGNIWDKLKAVMEYIINNVTQDNFTLKDPGNSGNDVADTLENFERANLKSRMETMLERIEDNSDHIKFYFPINDDFKQEEINEGYKRKDDNLYTVPSKKERFG